MKGAVLVAMAVALVAPAAATAAYPGSNGRIFFDVGGGAGAAIYSIRPDGSDRDRIVDRGQEPAVSADGRTIVFRRRADLYTANRTGGDVQQLTETDVAERSPSFSPSGNKILFATAGAGGNPAQIFTVRQDGSDRTRLTQGDRPSSDPEYSPNGNRIVFVRSEPVDHLFLMDADGTNVKQLTSGEFATQSPSWSPDGNRIAFEGLSEESFSIFAAKPNGTGLEQLTSAELGDREPAFAPSGDRVVFRGTRDDRSGLLVAGATGTPSIERLTTSKREPGVGADGDPYWSPSPSGTDRAGAARP